MLGFTLPQNSYINFPGPMTRYTVKKNRNGSVVSETLWYKETDRHKYCYFIILGLYLSLGYKKDDIHINVDIGLLPAETFIERFSFRRKHYKLENITNRE